MRVMTEAGYWLIIRDAQMWEAMFVKIHEEEIFTPDRQMYKSCDFDVAVKGAAEAITKTVTE